MTAKPRRKLSQAPKGRNKPAQGNALGNAPQETQSPEGARQDGRWPIATLGELAANERNAITDGPFGSKLKTDHYTHTGPRVIRLKNIGDTEFVDAKAYISEDHFAKLQKHRVFPGDVVIAALGEDPPRSCLVPEHLGPAIVKADCIRFKAGPRILPKFINYVLNAPDLRRYAKAIVHGVGRPRLNLGEIKGLPIPVPPIDDQRRIVAEIEKQFTRLEAGVAALRRVQANLKRYRAAVLKAACEGRLVPTEAELARAEGRPFESGQQLLARILTERRQNWQGRGQYKKPAVPDTTRLPSLPEGWTWATVEQLANKVQYGHTASAVKRDTGVRFLRITDIQDRRVEWDNVPSCDISPSDVEELRLLPGDLVFARTGATVGKSFLLKAPFPESVFASYLIRISPAGEYLSRWLHAFFQSPDYWAQIHESSAGIGQPNVNGTKLQALRVPIPPLAEQTRIVAEVERRLSVVEELEAVVTNNLQRATRLRQSILQKAFTGEL